MESTLKNRNIHSTYGILLQITVFIIGAFGLYRLITSFYYSLTSFNMLEKPSFVGFENYLRIFKDEIVLKSLGNTVVMVLAVTALLVVTAILPALFMARLKLPFGIGIIGAFSFISLFTMLQNPFKMIFSSDSYGMINSLLLSNKVITEPIAFTQTYAMLLSIILMWLYCLAPVFSVTYIAARMKHSFLGSAISICLIPILMCYNSSTITGVIGYPTMNNSADWLYTVFNDYLMVRYDIGFAYAILFVGIIMLIIWCLVVCLIAYGAWVLFKNISFDSTAFKNFGYITFAFSIGLFVIVLFYTLKYLLMAFMPTDELLVFPNNTFLPKKPTIENFSYLFKMTGFKVPFTKYIYNSLFAIPLAILPLCYLVALPSGVGLGLFQASKRQKWFLLCFIPFLFVSGYITLAEFRVIDTYFVYMFKFLSSFEFLIAVFLVYLAVRLVFYEQKLRISTLLLGIFFVLTAFYAIGVIRGVWYSGNGALYTEQLKNWRDISAYISAGGMARVNIAAANDILLIFTTLTAVIIPSAFLLMLYLSYQKNTKNLLK
jgi:multiple sugar transport system permease protein